jgi:hypothetical protein
MESEVVMRPYVLRFLLLTAVLFPTVGNAQVGQFRTHPPVVSAAGAEWQINSETMPFAGLVYYPTREIREFDGQVMVQIGVYQGVPIYADLTLEPYSLVYVPLGPTACGCTSGSAITNWRARPAAAHRRSPLKAHRWSPPQNGLL